VWDRHAGQTHYVHRSCSESSPPGRHLYPYPPSEPHPLSHPHPLSAPGRLLCRGDDYGSPYHHDHLHHHLHHAPPPAHAYLHHGNNNNNKGPAYPDGVLLEGGLAPPGCPCRDCGVLREEEDDAAAAAAVYHGIRLDSWDREAELQHRGAELQQRGGVPGELHHHWAEHRDPGQHPQQHRRARDMSLHWEREREAQLQWEREYWHRRATVASFAPHGQHDLPAFTFDPLPSGHPAYPEASRSHAHSHLDLKYSSSSSGYQTPRQACGPYGPYQPSPSESRGYASGCQSESTSPLPQPPGERAGHHGNGAPEHGQPPLSGSDPQVTGEHGPRKLTLRSIIHNNTSCDAIRYLVGAVHSILHNGVNHAYIISTGGPIFNTL